jgi:hypothetical protein
MRCSLRRNFREYKMRTINRIWIELDKPLNPEHGSLQCELANKLLAKLRPAGTEAHSEFYFDAEDKYYTYGGDMGYKILNDNGEWFNLDYLSK